MIFSCARFMGRACDPLDTTRRLTFGVAPAGAGHMLVGSSEIRKVACPTKPGLVPESRSSVR